MRLADVILEVVLITVKKVDLGVIVDCGSILEKRILVQNVIVIKEGDVVASCGFDADVCVASDSEVLLDFDEFDSGVRVTREGLGHVLILGTGVDKHELPVAIGLGKNRVQHVLEIGNWRVEERHNDADERLET